MTFASCITLYGDCTGTNVGVNVSVNDFEKLFSFSSDHASILKKPLKESLDRVNHAIKNLRPGGSTALGAGLLCSLGLIHVQYSLSFSKHANFHKGKTWFSHHSVY